MPEEDLELAREIIRRAEWLVRNNSHEIFAAAGFYDFSYEIDGYDLHISDVQGKSSDVWVEDDENILVDLENGVLKVYCRIHTLRRIVDKLRQHMILEDIARA